MKKKIAKKATVTSNTSFIPFGAWDPCFLSAKSSRPTLGSINKTADKIVAAQKNRSAQREEIRHDYFENFMLDVDMIEAAGGIPTIADYCRQFDKTVGTMRDKDDSASDVPSVRKLKGTAYVKHPTYRRISRMLAVAGTKKVSNRTTVLKKDLLQLQHIELVFVNLLLETHVEWSDIKRMCRAGDVSFERIKKAHAKALAGKDGARVKLGMGAHIMTLRTDAKAQRVA